MDSIEKKTAEKKEYGKAGRYLVVTCIVFSFIAALALMGYYANHVSEVGQWPQTTAMPEVVLTSPEKIDILKFIPGGSLVMQKLLNDIDQDGKEEIFLFYLVDPTDFVYPSRIGELNLMILKSDAKGKYNIAWQYDYSSMSYFPDYIKDRIYIYEKETGTPKIKFFIDNSADAGTNLFVYYDKSSKDFKILGIDNEGVGGSNSTIKGAIEIKDKDGDGLQEITQLFSGYIYKFDKDSHVYKIINSCFTTKTIPKIENSKIRIYRDNRYNYEIEFPAGSYIDCISNTVRLGEIRIFAPINDVDISKIDDYKCKVGKDFVRGYTPSGSYSTVCKKFYTDSGLETFKKTNYYPHDGSFETTYNIIRKENSQKFAVVQITTANIGNDDGEFNDAVETFKFVK